MKLRMYTIYDSKSETHCQPFFHYQDGQATRAFSDVVNNPETPIGKHPEDYTLFFCGTFDDATMDVVQVPPLSLGTGHNFKDQN